MPDPRADSPLWEWKTWAAQPCSRQECFERLQRVPDEFYLPTLEHLQYVWSVRRELESPGKSHGR